MWLRQRGRGQTGVSTVCWSTTAGVLSVSFSSKLYLRANAWNVGHCLFHGVHYPHQHTVDTPVCQTIVMAVGIICMFTHTWNNKVVSWEHFHCSWQLLEPLVFSSGMLSFCSFQRLVHAVLLEHDSVQRPCLFVCFAVLYWDVWRKLSAWPSGPYLAFGFWVWCMCCYQAEQVGLVFITWCKSTQNMLTICLKPYGNLRITCQQTAENFVVTCPLRCWQYSYYTWLEKNYPCAQVILCSGTK